MIDVLSLSLEYVTSRSPEEDLTAITRPVLPEDSEESPIEVEYEPPSVIETNEEVNKTTENKTGNVHMHTQQI